MVAGNLWGGCSDEFEDCKESHTCRVVVGETGQGGEGNAAGEGGSSATSLGGSGESAGAPVLVGGASSAGNAGAPSEAMAGAGGAAEVSRFIGCDGEPFEGNEAILTSCILRVGCQPWKWPTDSISRCLSDNTQKSYAYQRCSLNATSCDDIAQCEGDRDATEFCAAKADGSYCRDNEVVYCSNLYDYAHDCGRDSGICHEFGSGPDGPGAVCTLPALGICGNAGSRQCGGPGDAYVYECQEGTAYGTRCTRYDQECTGSGNASRCQAPRDCVTAGIACAGNVARMCDGNAKSEFDCGSVGLRCETTGSVAGDDGRHCLAPGCKREDAAACTENCSGANLTVCYGGSPVTVDCRDYGFKKCSEYEFTCDDWQSGDCVNSVDVVSFATCE